MANTNKNKVEKKLEAIHGKKISEGLWREINEELNHKFQVITVGNDVSVRRMYCENTGDELRGEPTFSFEVAFIRLDGDVIQNVEEVEKIATNKNNEIKPETKEQINHPSHYGGSDNPYEAIKVIRAWGANFNTGNTLKYISRAGKKDKTKTIEDLKKALWYLQDEINHLEKQK